MINQKNGKSVYLVSEPRIYNPQYVAARESVLRYTKTKTILELGGGPLHSTGVLTFDGIKVINLDADDSLLEYCRKNYPKARLVKTDLEQGLPDLEEIHKADVIIALDSLEHLEYGNTLKLLKQIREVEKGEDFVIVTVILVTDWLKLPTLFDWVRKFIDPKNVTKGLFDPTHKWFMTQAGHRKLFADSGYEIIEEETTNSIDGITGNWKTLDVSKISWLKNPIRWVENSKKLARAISWLLYPFDDIGRDKFVRSILVQRGFYVIRPVKQGL